MTFYFNVVHTKTYNKWEGTDKTDYDLTYRLIYVS